MHTKANRVRDYIIISRVKKGKKLHNDYGTIEMDLMHEQFDQLR